MHRKRTRSQAFGSRLEDAIGQPIRWRLEASWDGSVTEIVEQGNGGSLPWVLAERPWQPDAPADDWPFQRTPPRKRAKRKGEGAKYKAVCCVLAELYPSGVPDEGTLLNKELCKVVAARISYAISDDTILRAAGRQK